MLVIKLNLTMTKLITNRDRLTKLISTYKKKGKKIS